MRALSGLVALALLSAVAIFSLVSLESSSAVTGRSLLSDSDCDVVDKAKRYWHAMMNKDWHKLQNSYHRNALRYDNGALFPFTNGIPFTAEQSLCIEHLIDVRYQLKSIGRDHDEKYIGLSFAMYVELEPPVHVYASLEYDRAQCEISVERYFYDDTPSGVAKLVKTVAEPCFGSALAQRKAANNVKIIENCYDDFAHENAKGFAKCFADGVVFYGNGARLNGVENPDYWKKIFDVADFHDLEVLSVVRDPEDNSVSIFLSGEYTLKQESIHGGENTFTFYLMQSSVFNADGQIIRGNLVETDGDQQPLLKAMGSFMPIPETLNFQTAKAAAEYPDVLAVLGNPTLVMDEVRDGSGFAYWHSPMDLGCLENANLPDFVSSNGNIVSASYHIDIASSRRDMVNSLDPSTYYAPAERLLYTRQKHIGAAIVALKLAKQVADGVSASVVKAKWQNSIDALYMLDANNVIQRNSDGSIMYTEALDKAWNNLCNK